MRRHVYLLIAIILLYLVPALLLEAVYGPSYDMWSGEDCWIPDGEGGWTKHGNPDSPRPNVSSEEVPYWLQYLPIFLPAGLLILFLFTPLSRRLESPEDAETKEADITLEGTRSEDSDESTRI